MMPKKGSVGWGIIGTGSVTRQFCEQLSKVPNATIQNVVGSDGDKARKFAKSVGSLRSSLDLESLIADEHVDVIYISSPTRFHKQHAISALSGSKHVLCEKPFVTNSNDFREICELAAERKLFCMEGMWMRFNPLVEKARELVRDGSIGSVKSIQLEIGYSKSGDRLIDPNRGPIWDFAVYGLSLFQFLAGTPNKVKGIKASCYSCQQPATISALLEKDEIIATLSASTEIGLSNLAKITGTKGNLTLGPQFICPEYLRTNSAMFPGTFLNELFAKAAARLTGAATFANKRQLCASIPDGFLGQASHVTRAIQDGILESPVQPLSDTMGVIQLAESLHAQLSTAGD